MELSLLRGRLSTRAHGLADIAANRSAISFGGLAANRQTFDMADAAIAADFLHPLDIADDFSFQISFNDKFLFHDISKFINFRFGQIFDSGLRINLGRLEHFQGAGETNAKNIGQRNLYLFFRGNIDAGDSSLSHIL
jgi:hypothetical protein